jgi:hypothetical protein
LAARLGRVIRNAATELAAVANAFEVADRVSTDELDRNVELVRTG